MNKLLQLLIAIACIVVIAASGLWLLDRHQRIATAEAEAAAQAEVRRHAAEALARERVSVCEADLAAYDEGSILAFVVRANQRGGTPADMLAEVEKCRETIRRGY